MNKYQEALNRLVEGNYLTNREKKQFANILQELVDKETPMKVDLSTNWYFESYYDCPNCKREIEEDIRYCPYCGQKLDWSGKDG